MDTSSSRQVGLLVVHGIGEQHRLDTARKLVVGLQHAFPGDVSVLESDGTITIGLRGSRSTVRLYEVYWADLFEPAAKGSFVPEKIQSVALFPLLNRRHGLFHPARHWLYVVLWTLVLVPLSALAFASVLGGNIVAGARGVADSASRRAAGKATDDDHAESGDEYTPLDRLMDNAAGDIFQYVEGSIPSAPRGTTADRVRSRFYEQLAGAQGDGCDDIQVLAHSLGTVVAFNALTGYRHDDVPHGVSRLWTIGSPLEKFAFFFPAMTEVRDASSRPAWVNFRNPLDVVSGRLRSFPGWPVSNRRIWAGGVGTSHTVYERNRKVLEALTESLFQTPRSVPVSALRRAWGPVEAVLESLLVLAVLFLSVVAGLAVIVGAALLLPWLIGTAVGFFSSDAVEGRVKDWGSVVLGLPFLAVFLFFGPLRLSGKDHQAWRTP